MKLCCLCCIPCASEYKKLQNALGDYNENYEIVVKYFDPKLLTEHIDSESSEGKIVCQNCWLHLNDFHNFQQTILNMRKLLKQSWSQRSPLHVQVEEEPIPAIFSDDYNEGDNEEIRQSNNSPTTNDFQQTILKIGTPLEQICIQRSPLHVKVEEHVPAVLSHDYIVNEDLIQLKNFPMIHIQENIVNSATSASSIREEHSTARNQQLNKDQNQLEDSFEMFNDDDEKLREVAKTPEPNKEIVCEKQNRETDNESESEKPQSRSDDDYVDLCSVDGDDHYSGDDDYVNLCSGDDDNHYSGDDDYVDLCSGDDEKGNKDLICKECGKVYILDFDLENHIKLVHLRERAGAEKPKFPCDECGKEMSNRNTLKIHKKRCHTNTVYVCSICGKALASENGLRNHRKYVHEIERKHKCPHCVKVFKMQQKLREHMLSHTDEQLYQCPHCSRSFNYNSTYTRHLRKDHLIDCGKVRKSAGNTKIDYERVTNIAVI